MSSLQRPRSHSIVYMYLFEAWYEINVNLPLFVVMFAGGNGLMRWCSIRPFPMGESSVTQIVATRARLDYRKTKRDADCISDPRIHSPIT